VERLTWIDIIELEMLMSYMEIELSIHKDETELKIH
jgi:hypothetical protein